MNWPLLSKFMSYVQNQTGKGKLSLWIGMKSSVLKYNISLLEYFQFHFYKLNHLEKLEWAGTGYMYEYQKIMNPLKERFILDDKRIFFKQYRKFFLHQSVPRDELARDMQLLQDLLKDPERKLVFKSADGNCGIGVEIYKVKDLGGKFLLSFMEEKKFDLVEDFVVQHAALNALSPSGVNTIRIFTQLDKENRVHFLGCRLRISISSPVDNMAAGNIAAPIDEQTGIVTGPGVYSDITKKDEFNHPVTGVSIVGFQIPYWKETVEMIKSAAVLHPQNKSIGWDIVITDKGPGLIEGNHDWCKLLWQLPVKKGLKQLLEPYRKMYA
jgi:hypothetical protein